MRLIMKVLAAPVIVVLTVAVSVSKLALVVSGAVLGFASVVAFLLSVCTIFMFGVERGVPCVVASFLISPLGLPRLALWLVGRLDSFNHALKAFVMG